MTKIDALISEGSALLAEIHDGDGRCWRFSEIVCDLHRGSSKMSLRNIGVAFGPSPRTGEPYSKAWSLMWIRAWERYGHLPVDERPPFWEAAGAPVDAEPVRQAVRRTRREGDPSTHARRLIGALLGRDRLAELSRDRRALLAQQVVTAVGELLAAELSPRRSSELAAVSS